jgi:hypothetical protein
MRGDLERSRGIVTGRTDSTPLSPQDFVTRYLIKRNRCEAQSGGANLELSRSTQIRMLALRRCAGSLGRSSYPCRGRASGRRYSCKRSHHWRALFGIISEGSIAFEDPYSALRAHGEAYQQSRHRSNRGLSVYLRYSTTRRGKSLRLAARMWLNVRSQLSANISLCAMDSH